MCGGVCVGVGVFVSLCAGVCVCLSLFLCVYVSVCLCVCVCGCVDYPPRLGAYLLEARCVTHTLSKVVHALQSRGLKTLPRQ